MNQLSHVYHRRNQHRSQYIQKRFNNKHAKSTWRHYHQKRHYKKELRHKKKVLMKHNLLMDYNDEWSVYQQNLQQEIGCMEEETLTRRYKLMNPDKSLKRYTRALSECGDYINNVLNVMSTEYNPNDYYDLLNLQLKNYEKNCDSMFLNYKNWAIYELKIQSFQNMYRAFGKHLMNMWISHNSASVGGVLAYSYYETLSTHYYDYMLSGAIRSKDEWGHEAYETKTGWVHLDEEQWKCIELKNAHCDIILNRILFLGQKAMSQTLDTIYCAIPSLSVDMCQIIIDFMAPFPQTPPTSATNGYDYGYDWHGESDGIANNFWIAATVSLSKTEMLVDNYAYIFGLLSLDIPGADVITLKFDDENVKCKFDIMDIGIDGINDELHKEYQVTETYHTYRSYEETVMVGLLECDQSIPLYMYIHHNECEGSVIILSQFWMDLWQQIESKCIQADCYNAELETIDQEFESKMSINIKREHDNGNDISDVEEVIYEYE